MFNSVAKYLWGSAENESDYTDPQMLPGQGHPVEGPQGDGEHHQAPLLMPAEECGQEDDWVLVADADKENSNTSPVQQHYPHHHHHPHHINSNPHHQSPHNSDDSSAGEVELLDDAASLVTHHQGGDHKSLSDQEDNGLDSGVRPSSPESVFSACSGRSSATYRPRGVDSEAWIVAPPPCFTGSQCGSLSPLVSSPLENLLIEHPSMSVYVSQPATHIINSSLSYNDGNMFSLNSDEGMSSVLHISGSSNTLLQDAADTNNTSTAADANRLLGDRLENDAVRSRRSHGDAALHQHHISVEKIRQSQNSAQRRAISISQRSSVSKQKCQRQNIVRQVSSAPKGRINRRNKQICPSGFRCSRFSQRNNSSSAKNV